MDKIADLIAQLADPDAKKRLAAVEALRVIPALPPEAIFALKSAALDGDASVAASARAALARYEPSQPPQKPRNVLSAVDSALQPSPGMPRSDRDVRLRGVLFLLLSAVLGYFGIYRPISRALSGAPSISYSPEMASLAVIVATAGLSTLVFGAKADAVLRRGPTRPLLRLVFIVAIAILAIAGYMGMKYIMTSLGYR